MSPEKVRTIGIVYNLKPENISSDQYEEYDEFRTIEALRAELKRLGFEVLLLEQTVDLSVRLAGTRPDFVLNIAEGIGGGAKPL